MLKQSTTRRGERAKPEIRMNVSIIIVNWNAGNLLRECLDSINQQAGISALEFEVIVVDNGSTDDSLVLGAYRFALHAIRNVQNVGFAKACNQGARQARGDYLLFFNPDCVLKPGSLEAAVTAIREDASIGVVGVALIDESGHISRSCHRFPRMRHFLGRISGLARFFPRELDSAMTTWNHAEDKDVDHVIGAFYLIPRALFDTLGGFDERFFVYLEDLDLSLRVRRLGRRVRFLAGSPSYHKGGGTSEKAKAARLFYATRSRILYAFKHFSFVAAWVHLGATLTVEPLCRVVDLVMRRRLSEVREVTSSFSMLFHDLPDILRAARRA